MKEILITIVLFVITGLSPVLARLETVNSPRSTFVLHVPSKWINSGTEIDVVRIQKENVKGNKDTIIVQLDSKGLRAVTVPQDFPLKVTTTLPSADFPFVLVIIEKQKEGIETELIEAVALKEGVARFLSKEEYGILAGTHAAIPSTIDNLNKDLNELRKK
jgi:hypothetical protein